jgi:hypothetical protein
MVGGTEVGETGFNVGLGVNSDGAVDEVGGLTREVGSELGLLDILEVGEGVR